MATSEEGGLKMPAMPEMPKIEVRTRQIRGRGFPGSSFCAAGRPERAAVRGNLREYGHEELDPFNGEGGCGGGRGLFCWRQNVHPTWAFVTG